MLSFLLSPFAKIMGCLLLVGALAGGVKLWFVEHDKAVIASLTAAETATRLASMAADNARLVSALQDQSEANALRATLLTKAREAVASAPQSTSCSQSASVRAALVGLRKPASGHSGPANVHTGAAKNVPAATRPAAR